MNASMDETEIRLCPDERRREYNLVMLGLAIAVVLLALAFEVRPDQRVAFAVLPRWPIPETCQSRRLFGIDCPGCGLTRSVVHLAHLRVRDSLAVHPLGWLMFLLIVLQIPYRLLALARHDDTPLGTRFPRYVGATLIALLIGTWLLRTALHWVG